MRPRDVCGIIRTAVSITSPTSSVTRRCTISPPTVVARGVHQPAPAASRGVGSRFFVVKAKNAPTNRRHLGGRGLLATMATTTTAAAGDDDLIERKKATRRRVRAALKELTETQMSAESTAICASLLSTLQIFKETSDACVQRPLRLGLYVHCAKLREVDTRPLLKTALALGDACEVYVPIVDAPADGNDGVGPAMRFLKIQNLDKDLEPKTMGILEPTEFLGDGVTPRPNLEKDWATSGSNPRPPLDALLIPGLAFDRTGNRCGRGGGYYDAFISRYFEKCEQEFGLQPPPLVALAYSAQVLPPGDVPMAAYDRKVDAIATKDGVLACTPLGEKVSSGSGWLGPGLGWDAR